MANFLDNDETTAKMWSEQIYKQAIADTVLMRWFPPSSFKPLTRAQKINRWVEDWQYRLAHAWSALRGERCDEY